MSTPQSGPPDPPGQPTDTGEFRSQQGVELGWVAEIEQGLIPELKNLYVPEYESNGKRLTTTWRRGGIPGVPFVENQAPEQQPNYFIGEQYLEMNYAPQKVVFARAPVPIREQPTPMIGYHRTGYKQISNAVFTIQTRIWAFDDDDGWELFQALVQAAYIQTVGSALQAVWESLAFQPKRIGTRGVVMEFGLRIGVPVFLPPLTPARPCQINQRTEICLPK